MPTIPEDKIDFHFVRFVKLRKTGHVHEPHGIGKILVIRRLLLGPDGDMLAEGGLYLVRELIQRETDSNFGLMALALT